MFNYKTILCYGDSNTWGYIPSLNHEVKARYSRDQRWPKILQALLGESYEVVEEGLNSRTTNIDHLVPPDRNGETYLAPCLYSHAPIDLVIFALGGNDAKTYFNRSAGDITNGLAALVDIVQQSFYGPELKASPQVLILAPAVPETFIETFTDEEGVQFLQGAVEKISALKTLYLGLAQEKNCHYLDMSDVQASPIDGVHLDEAGHQQYAQLLYQKIIKIL